MDGAGQSRSSFFPRLTAQHGPPPPTRRPPSSAFEHACAELLNFKSDNIVFIGAELGLWMFGAFSLEVLGVQLISATKTAFLNQATVLITPLLVHLSGEHVKRHEWLACGLGLAGSLLVAADGLTRAGDAGGIHGAVAADQENPIGYLYVLISAVFFALSTVRLSRYSSSFPSLTLASSSTFGLSFFSLVWVLASWQGTALESRPRIVRVSNLALEIGTLMPYALVTRLPSSGGDASTSFGQTVTSLRHLFSDPVSLAVMLWVGLGPGALAAYLQASGQQQVPPAQAQVGPPRLLSDCCIQRPCH